MLSHRTIRSLKNVYLLLCSFGSIPFTCENKEALFKLQCVTTAIRIFHSKVIFFATICHTFFLALRLVQAYLTRSQRFFLLFIHFGWSSAFIMITWMHISLMIDRSEVKAYFNGLIQFYSSYFSMPGARFSAKVRQWSRRKPCLVDLLVSAFMIGAVMNTFVTVLVFLIYSESYQFIYSTLPPCWKANYPAIKFLLLIYETAMPGVNWALILFFVIIHLVHLLCTRDYLLMMRKNTRNGIPLNQLLHYYRSIQILQNNYNECIASYMPLQLFVVVSLTLAGNIGTIRLFHKAGHITLPEMTLLPMTSVLTIAFQLIFYQRAGELFHLSSFFSKSAKKGLYKDSKLAKMYLKSFTPLCVKIGNLLRIRKFTVVRFVSSIVIATARLSMLFFRNKKV